MFSFKLVRILVLLSLALCVASSSLGLPEYIDADASESQAEELVRSRRAADPRRGALLNALLSNKHGSNYEYRPTYQEYRPTYQEYRPTYQEHRPSGGNTATFAQSSAGTISTNNGHGGSGGQSSSQSASYNFGPFSASFSTSQSNGNGGGFFDY